MGGRSRGQILRKMEQSGVADLSKFQRCKGIIRNNKGIKGDEWQE